MTTPPSMTTALNEPAIRRYRWVAVIACVALIILSLAWERWLAPLRPGGSWLMLKALPLLLPLPGLLKGKRYAYQWSSMLILLYLCEGLVRATSDTGLNQILGAVETMLAMVYFVSVLAFCYATRPSLTNPALKRTHKKR